MPGLPATRLNNIPAHQKLQNHPLRIGHHGDYPIWGNWVWDLEIQQEGAKADTLCQLFSRSENWWVLEDKQNSNLPDAVSGDKGGKQENE